MLAGEQRIWRVCHSLHTSLPAARPADGDWRLPARQYHVQVDQDEVCLLLLLDSGHFFLCVSFCGSCEVVIHAEFITNKYVVNV